MGKKIGKYELGHTLGSGAFSKVKLATDTQTGEKWAVKIIDKEQLAREHLEEQLKREIAIMKSLSHPHIVYLKEVMQTHNHIYMVLEVVKGGELFDRIVEAKKFEESVARRYFQQLVGAVKYCHSQGIAHRDIKPENLLLDERDNLKISDFGLSNLQPSNRAGLLQTVCGTPNYVAPEVLKERGYDGFKADAWSCGIVLFVMLAGYLPFDDQNQNALFNKIERGDYRMSRTFTDGAKDLISKLILVDPAKRVGLDEVMKHPWFQVDLDKVMVDGRSSAPTQGEIDNAIQNEKEDEGASPKAASPASKASGSQSATSPTGAEPVDAFGVVAMLTHGMLGSHAAISGAQEVAKKSYHLLVQGDVQDVVQAMNALNCNAKTTAVNEARGFHNGAHGLITFTATGLTTTAPNLSIVEIKRGRGDAIEFQSLIEQVGAQLGPKLKSSLVKE
jgi:serine/threonine protein kinase